MATLIPFPLHEFDDDGKPLAGGKLYSYNAGTDDDKPLYSDASGDTELTVENPAILDSTGRLTAFLGTGKYRLVLKNSTDSQTFWDVDNIPGSGGTISSLMCVKTISDLRALGDGVADAVIVLSYSILGDRGGGLFYWDSESSVKDDNGVVIIPDDTPETGRWIREFDGQVDLRFFGAQGDDETDDAAALIDAEAYVEKNPGKVLIATQGTYVIDSDPSLTSPCIMEPNACFKWTAAINTTFAPLIDIADETLHFDCPDDHTPILAGIKAVSPHWFGAVGDGSTGDSAAWIKTISSTEDQKGVHVVASPGKSYGIDGADGFHIENRSDITFDFLGAKLGKINTAGDVFTLGGCTHIEINNLQILGGGWGSIGLKLNQEANTPCEQIMVNDLYIDCPLASSVGIQIGDNTNDPNNNGAIGCLFNRIQIKDTPVGIEIDSRDSQGNMFKNTRFSGVFKSCAVITQGDVAIDGAVIELGTVDEFSPKLFTVKDGSLALSNVQYQTTKYGLFLEMLDQDSTFVSANPYKRTATVFENVSVSCPGNQSDNRIIYLDEESRNLVLEGCQLVGTSASPVAFEASAGTLSSHGTRYSVPSVGEFPWVSVGNEGYGPVESKGDIFVVGTGNDYPAPDCNLRPRTDENSVESEKARFFTQDPVYQNIRWQGHNFATTGSIYELGKIGYVSSDNGEFTGLRVQVGNNSGDEDTLATILTGEGANGSNNLLTIYGRLRECQGGNLAVESDISVGNGNFFTITSGTILKTISITGWANGSKIYLSNTSGNIVYLADGWNSAPFYGNGCFALSGGSTRALLHNDIICFVLDGTTWREFPTNSGMSGKGSAATLDNYGTYDTLTVTNDGILHDITGGSDQIDLISTTGFHSGSIIYLSSANECKFRSLSSATKTGFANISIRTGSSPYTMAGTPEVVSFIYNGTCWCMLGVN